MTEHKEIATTQKVSPNILPIPPNDEFVESLPEDYLFDGVDFPQRFVFSNFVQRDGRLR